MDELPKYIRLQIQVGAIPVPALRAMQSASDIVSLTLGELGAHDFSGAPELGGSLLRLSFTDNGISPDMRREECRNFLIRHLFQGVVGGLKRSLEEAYILIGVSRHNWSHDNVRQFDEVRRRLHRRANKMKMQEHMDFLVGEAAVEIEHIGTVANLQKVRNCLEHRDGIVGQLDANTPEKDKIRLEMPTIELMAKFGDGEPLTALKRSDLPRYIESVQTRFTTEIIEASVGERLIIDPDRFNHIIFSIVRITQELVQVVDGILRDDDNLNYSTEIPQILLQRDG